MKARQQSEGSFTPLPIGVHTSVLLALVDLGMQPGGQYAPAYKTAFIWQTPDQTAESGEPMTITKVFTSSMHKKSNLRKTIESWFGKAFPSEEAAKDFKLETLLGRPCLLNVTHDQKGDKTYANVASVIPLPASMPKPTLKGETFFYDEELPPAERSAAYQRVPEWLRKKIDEQLRPQKASSDAGTGNREAGSDDDIPF